MTTEERARRCLEWYLQGRNQMGHEPLTINEVAHVYGNILKRLRAEEEHEHPDPREDLGNGVGGRGARQ